MPKLLAFDIDGVFTDGRVIVDQNGIESKTIAYHDMDAFTVLNRGDYITAFITKEDTPLARWFNERLKPDHFFCGCIEKARVLVELAQSREIPMKESLYIGDGRSDIEAVKLAGIGVCPANAIDEVKSVAKVVLKNCGGYGAIVELEQLLRDGL